VFRRIQPGGTAIAGGIEGDILPLHPVRTLTASRALLATFLLAGVCAGSANADYRPLRPIWTLNTGGPIAARPVESKGVVFAGSWDGREYAIRAKTGRVLWKRSLGITSSDRCAFYTTAGITSAPVVAGGLAYLGGGDAYWYALDARTGAVRWRVFTGDNSPGGGHYNWSSPTVFRGHAFVGISSLCDNPLVQGRLLRVDLASHAIDGAWNVVADGHQGGTIWTKPVVEGARNRLFVTTGNGEDTYAESIVALHAESLQPLDSWKLPEKERVFDSDWGTSPTLLTDSRGRRLVAAANKNGLLYAFRRNALHEGPVWRRRVAVAGECPNCGTGTVSTGTFDGRRLYYAGGGTKLGKRTYRGSVRAVDPATGRPLWSRGLPGAVLGGLVRAHGRLYVASEAGLYVLRMRDGAVLHENRFRYGKLWATPLVDKNRVVIGTVAGAIRAYRLPR
jgi:outer membrane protein assembly factor BamB